MKAQVAYTVHRKEALPLLQVLMMHALLVLCVRVASKNMKQNRDNASKFPLKG